MKTKEIEIIEYESIDYPYGELSVDLSGCGLEEGKIVRSWFQFSTCPLGDQHNLIDGRHRHRLWNCWNAHLYMHIVCKVLCRVFPSSERRIGLTGST